jgi:hypothetical protein
LTFQAFARKLGYGRYSFYEESVDWEAAVDGSSNLVDETEGAEVMDTYIDFMNPKPFNPAVFEGWDRGLGLNDEEDEVDVRPTDPAERVRRVMRRI